jgi:ZIP family zinc transporter
VPLLLSLIAGLSTTLGAVFVFLSKKPKFMCVAMGFAAGVMIYLSFVELLAEGITNVGYIPAVIAFFVGIFSIMLIDFFIPHKYQEENADERYKLKRMGTIIAIGIFIHNFPEGIITFFSSIISPNLGLSVALAVALHNIPEGMAVSLPIYKATGSKRKAFLYSFLSGIAEPIGALLSFFFLWNFLTMELIYLVVAAVAGVMIFISIDELLPFALKDNLRHNRNTHQHRIILGVFLGMMVMAVSLALI